MSEHLTASMRVLRTHQHRPAATVKTRIETAKELALRLGTDKATAVALVVEEKLKKATGDDVAALECRAESWRD